MAVDVQKLRIVHYPDPVLRQVAQPVEPLNDEVRAVALQMIQLMHEAQGVGLAAPQVGLPWRMFVANPTGEPQDDAVYINPTLCEPQRTTEAAEEGCLSLPGIRGEITRPTGITLAATDFHGQPITRTASGLEARIWQHEYDHLDGVLIIDKMPSVDRRANRRALKELEGF
jgi:peptide deformylase